MSLRHDIACDYWKYTGPYRQERDVAVLDGMLQAIAFDGRVADGERELLDCWLHENRGLQRFPFDKLRERIGHAIADGELTQDELAGLRAICSQFLDERPRFDADTQDMQRLHGILGGVAADGDVSRDEAQQVKAWLQDHEHLQGMWPYDEIDSILLKATADGHPEAEVQKRFALGVCREFVFGSAALLILEEDVEALAQWGVCAACPNIEFPQKVFCFTGNSTRGKRAQLGERVVTLGGIHDDNVTKRLNYLVVAPDGNRAWAFACYGRKIDFWDAVQDAG